MSKKKSLADYYTDPIAAEPSATPSAASGLTVRITDLIAGKGKPIYEVSGVASISFAQNNLYSVTLVLQSGSIQTLMLSDGWLVEQL